ncbi:MAG TPA: hypothetical protein VKB78_14155, partial [Pirellulales bacterium]|nr:hypothetical protein [Pirellulales bacterium]
MRLRHFIIGIVVIVSAGIWQTLAAQQPAAQPPVSQPPVVRPPAGQPPAGQPPVVQQPGAQPQTAQQLNAPGAADLVKHGEYLVNSVSMCSHCHTPQNEQGQLDRTRLLQGTTL